MDKMKFTSNEIEKEYNEHLKKISEKLESPIDDTKYAWNETIKEYAVKIEKVKRLFSLEEISDEINKRLIADIDNFLGKCADPEYHIALVGDVKAGKSTLINALIDHDLAPTDVTPETAALTKFKSTDENYIRVSFYSKKEWDDVWNTIKKSNSSKKSIFLDEYNKLNAERKKDEWLGKKVYENHFNNIDELKENMNRWVSSKSPEHYFVKDVTIGLKELNLPKGVILVDTPGLDDPSEYRSDITRDYINRANAVLICIKSDVLRGNTFQFITRVFTNVGDNKEKVYIVATQKDKLNDINKDWNKQEKEWIKYLKTKSCYGDFSLAKEKIIAISAYVYGQMNNCERVKQKDFNDEFFNLAKIIYSINKDNKIDSPKDIIKYSKEVKDFSNIDYLKNTLKEKIISKYEKLFIKDIESTYKLLDAQIREVMNNLERTQKEYIEDTQKSIDDIKSKKEENEKILKEAFEEQEKLNKLIAEINGETEKQFKELKKALEGIAKKIAN